MTEYGNITIDKDASGATAETTPAFPWVRFDAGLFTWEEAFHEGRYMTVHYSAMGRCQSRERLYGKLRHARFYKRHLNAFELAIDGQLLKDRFRWVREETGRTAQGFEELVVVLAHELAPVEVRIHTALDGTSFLVRQLEIVNTGDRPFAVTRVFPLAGIFSSDGLGSAIVGDASRPQLWLGAYARGATNVEGEFEWRQLRSGTVKFANEGHFYNPPLYLVKNESTGETAVFHAAWSGSIQAEFSLVGDLEIPHVPPDYLHVKIGMSDDTTYRVVQPGETLRTPAVHFAMLYGDLDACVNGLYAHLRTSVVPRQPEGVRHLVGYNHTGYTYNAQISKSLLLDEADVAAEIGAELFMVDAGWYGPKEKAWHEAIGDWHENELLEGGLKDVFDYVRAKGMKCGLWMPIENVSLSSEFAGRHPDWLLVKGGKPCGVLDITNPEVEQYMYETIVGAIGKYGLDCFRIDGGLGGPGGERVADGRLEYTGWLYFEKLYGLFDRVKQACPHILLENCSGGGGRMDAGLMRRFHWTQITDNWHPAKQLRIFNGVTLGLPPEQCMTLVGAINMHPAEVDFVVRAGFFGHLCVSGAFPSVRQMNTPALAAWRRGIQFYKENIRPILDTCNVYHHTPLQDYKRQGDWIVLEYADERAVQAVAGIFRLNAGDSAYTFIAKGVDLTGHYEVRFENSGAVVRVSGFQLGTAGISVRVNGRMMSELLYLRKLNDI